MPDTQTPAVPLTPTWNGFIKTTEDALLLVEGVLRGELNHVSRRPHDRERERLIKSGSVFIYSEGSSGIRRWTDGIHWSPSRILGNFLLYRELESPFAPGQKKRALKNKKPSHPYGGASQVPAEDREFIGSLVDSYAFKPNGLIKKTISVDFHGIAHHIVSYYTLAEAKSQTLPTPTSLPKFRNYMIRAGITVPAQSRNPQPGETIYGSQAAENPSGHAHAAFSAAPLASPYGMGLLHADHYDQQQAFPPAPTGHYGEYIAGGVSNRHYSQGSIRHSFQAPGSFAQQQTRVEPNNQGYSSNLQHQFLDHHDNSFDAVPSAAQLPHVIQAPAMTQMAYESANQSQTVTAMEPRNLVRQEGSQNQAVSNQWDGAFPQYENTHHPAPLFPYPANQNW